MFITETFQGWINLILWGICSIQYISIQILHLHMKYTVMTTPLSPLLFEKLSMDILTNRIFVNVIVNNCDAFCAKYFQNQLS